MPINIVKNKDPFPFSLRLLMFDVVPRSGGKSYKILAPFLANRDFSESGQITNWALMGEVYKKNIEQLSLGP